MDYGNLTADKDGKLTVDYFAVLENARHSGTDKRLTSIQFPPKDYHAFRQCVFAISPAMADAWPYVDGVLIEAHPHIREGYGAVYEAI